MSEMDPDVVLGNVGPDPALETDRDLDLEPSIDLETPEADAVEQSQVVVGDDEDEYR